MKNLPFDKKNQHYVWQSYLEPWTINKKINCLRNNEKIITTLPRNIASERYFNTLVSLTISDLDAIEMIYINNNDDARMKQTLSGWIAPFRQTLEFMIKTKTINSETAKWALNNVLEEFHSGIEGSGVSGLKKIKEGNITDLFNDEEERINFIIYLSIQYFRTKNMKRRHIEIAPNLINKMKKSPLSDNNNQKLMHLFNNMENAYNLIAIVFATRLGYGLNKSLVTKEYHYHILENKTNIAFVTTDQPVANIFANPNDNKAPEEMKLYYPIAPDKALLITKNTDIDKCTDDIVNKYNENIVKHSNELIFANNAEVLKGYKHNK